MRRQQLPACKHTAGLYLRKGCADCLKRHGHPFRGALSFSGTCSYLRSDAEDVHGYAEGLRAVLSLPVG